MVAGPRWRELADRLEADIRAGRRAPGEKLPSLAEWAQSDPPYSQTVTMRAYRALEAKGLVEAVHGLGTFVTATVPAGTASLEDRVTRLEDRVTRLESGGAAIKRSTELRAHD